MLSRVFRVHFVGIGGIGMSGIAEVLLVQGWPVSGSDTRPSPITSRLMEMGARIVIGHAAANLCDAEVVVTSSAVAADNPEVVAARERQIPVIPRAEMLAELMRLKFGIAVAGMHGKTTTTSMIATVLAGVGLDPTVIVGGRLDSIGSNAKLGTTQYLVAEADESDRSFLQLSPIVAVITNLDREHLDCYSGLGDIQDAFVAFANRVPFYGTVLVGAEDDATRAILPRLRRRTLVYGTSDDADLHVAATEFDGGDSRFRLTCSAAGCHLLGTRARAALGTFMVPRPGLHSVLDATAAIAVGLLLGGELEAVRAAIGNFRGVDRRFQIRGRVGDEASGITVVDDYGHHPTELAATLAAARQYQAKSKGRVLMLFQPHRYTRTFHLMEEFASTLARADQAWLLDIYSAGEAPIEGIHSSRLAQRANEQHGGNVAYLPDAEAAIAAIAAAARPGDLILTQGAGSVSGLGEKLLQALTVGHAASALQTSSL
jgi:UDP-N-acetylmuramate--alanine ligase